MRRASQVDSMEMETLLALDGNCNLVTDTSINEIVSDWNFHGGDIYANTVGIDDNDSTILRWM